MSKEYIEKEAALTEFRKACNFCRVLVGRPMCGECSVSDSIYEVKRIPPADVKPVVRGEWMEPEGSECVHAFAGEVSISLPSKKCSVCGHLAVTFPKSNFCPNCGADMRKEEEE